MLPKAPAKIKEIQTSFGELKVLFNLYKQITKG